jgi:hypothetical protein
MPFLLQTARKIEIFHQRDETVPPHALEDIPPYENRLVPRRDAAHPRPDIHQIADEPAETGTPVKLDVEAPSDAARVPQGIGDAAPGMVGQNRIGMKEQQDIASAQLGRRIHLKSTSRLRGDRHHGAISNGVPLLRQCKLHHDVPCAIDASAVGYDNIVKSEPECMSQSRRE